jgi:hypothetical protein
LAFVFPVPGHFQGCNLLPVLYNTCIEEGKEAAQEQGIKGIKLKEEEMNMIHIADNIAVVAGSEVNLHNSLNTIEKVFQEYNMKIN